MKIRVENLWLAVPLLLLATLVIVVMAYSELSRASALEGPLIGDTNCNSGLDGYDALGIIGAHGGIDPQQEEDCPVIGTTTVVAGLERIFGDLDCSGSVDPLDALVILRYLGRVPYSQAEPCLDVGVVATDFEYEIDTGLEPNADAVTPLKGGDARPTAAVVGPDGGQMDFVVNELQFKVNSPDDLDEFLDKYNGTVLRDDSVFIPDGAGVQKIAGVGDGWHLVRVDLSTSAVDDLTVNGVNSAFYGEWAFSSPEAARLYALVLRETSLTLAPNFVGYASTIEDPTVSNSDQWWWMQDRSIFNEDEGNSFGPSIIKAWDFLRNGDFPPQNGIWQPARVAIIDAGFAIDGNGGGSPDWKLGIGNIEQVDLVDGDGNAGGKDEWISWPWVQDSAWDGWHGEAVFGVCCARPRNEFGGAGSGGEYVRPIPIRVGQTMGDWGYAIRAAGLMTADVATMSIGMPCFVACYSMSGSDNLQQAVWTAGSLGTVVFAAAGNNGWNIDDPLPIPEPYRQIPCELDQVICVGAIDSEGNNVFNWGSPVDIWAPDFIYSTQNPETGTMDPFQGTSASAPFAAGVAAMLKAIDHSLTWEDVQNILQSTANPSEDPKVTVGYVNAFEAVRQVFDNPPPQIESVGASTGCCYEWYLKNTWSATVIDPPGTFEGRVEFWSDQDGFMCLFLYSDNPFDNKCDERLSPGVHQIRVFVEDEFDQTDEELYEIEIINSPPQALIQSPSDGETYYIGQDIPFSAFIQDVFEPVEEQFHVVWSSDIDGVLLDIAPTPTPSPGPSTPSPTPPFSPTPTPPPPSTDFSSMLSEGVHVITLSVTDLQGATTVDTVTIEVASGGGPPIATILSPPNNYNASYANVNFVGTGYDPEDGTLSGASLEWYSNIDGFLGTGGNLTVSLSNPGCDTVEVHSITLVATDSDANEDTDSIQFFASGSIC